MLVSLLSVSAYPPEYGSWFSYIRDMGNLDGIRAVPAFYAANYYLGKNGVFILMLALFGVIITSLIGNMLALSRVLYAAGREREMPELFSVLSRCGIPVNAIVAVAVVSAVIPFLGRTAIGWIVDVTTLGATIIYGLISHGVYFSADKSGNRIEKITGLAGMVLMVLFGIVLLVPGLLAFEAMETESYILFISWAVLGLIYFRRLIKKDRNREYSQRMIVWIALLILILFESMMWVSRMTENAAENAVHRIYEYHQTHPEHDNRPDDIEKRESFLEEQAAYIGRINMLYTVVSLGLFLLCIGIMLNNYKDNQKLGTRLTEAEAEARSVKKIAELRESISSLLDNMLVMSFSKDAGTGEYLACNQAYADYAVKESPESVVGLTDHEIFDKETADHFVEDDKKALSMDEPFIIYEEVPDAAGEKRLFQTIKLKFYDANGRLCLLGMSLDETEMMLAKRENDQTKAAYKEVMNTRIIYEGFLDALSEDYFDLYYVDTKNDSYVEYGSKTEAGHLGNVEHGINFFSEAREMALTYLYEDDQKKFIDAMYKDKMLTEINSHGSYVIQYRLMINDAPAYVNLKATSVPGDEKHIIIGINNVDAQVKDRKAAEKAREEQKSYMRMNALNGNLIVLYIVDPETEQYKEFSATKDYEQFGVAKEGNDFFASTLERGKKVVYKDDLELFTSVISRDNVISSIESSGVFELDYRLMMGGVPSYIRFKAAKVEEDGKPMLIIGLLNVDAQIKHEQEYARNLTVAKTMAMTDKLTGAKNKHAYSEVEKELNQEIKDNRNLEFAVVVCDVNGLKIINDTYGHKAGDDYIRSAFGIICNVFKRSPVFRVGGDEFVALCQGHDLEHIDELMNQMEATNLNNKEKGEVQIAYGMSKYDKDSDVTAVFERADQLMYEKKTMMKKII